MHRYKELKLWKEAIELVDLIYKITKSFPQNENFGLIAQMRRSAVSIPSNIAEGAGRNSNAQFLSFLQIAMGSAFELETQLIIANRQGYIREGDFNELIEKLTVILKMNNNFQKSLKNDSKR